SVYFFNDSHEIEFGGEVIHHTFLPNKINALTDEQVLNFGDVQNIKAVEYASFINSRHNFNEKWLLSIGLRHSAYWQLGPFKRFVSDANFLITDTIAYSNNRKVSFYQNLEPRLAIRYALSQESSV